MLMVQRKKMKRKLELNQCKKCNHLVSVNLLELQISELELEIKALKKAKRYSKIVEEE